uniref:SH2 domain-containing protein n=1 Tax=Caenorhabditis japonica TaxID=281687 RepID=A0A8R1DPP8_CAEJA
MIWKKLFTAKMYNRLKSSLLNHFQKGGSGGSGGSSGSPNGLSREEKKRLRHSLAECHLTDALSYHHHHHHQNSAHPYCHPPPPPPPPRDHAPLAPAEEYFDESSSSSTFYSDLLASSFTDSAYCSSGLATQNGDYEDQNDIVIMPSSAALSWNVQYVGSFPISNSDELGRRIDNFQGNGQWQNVELSISVLGVRICCEKTVLMSHSLRRVTDISARPFTHNVGYMATEPVGRTYRRLCHVFHCQSLKEAEEIETVLRNTHKSADGLDTRTCSKVTGLMHTTNTTSTMTEKRSASTVFLNRFLGKKGSQTVDETGQCKRKRRPVSAVFSSAIHRLSSSTSSVNPKRMSTIEQPTSNATTTTTTTTSTTTKDHLLQQLQNQMRCAAEDTPFATSTSTSSVASSSSGHSSTGSTSTSPVPPQTSLLFDDKLGEWIYPIDATVTAQLDNCSYFVGYPTRDSLAYNLLSQPEGAFVIRYSESKSKCLALSMRVPVSHNPGGISHYLIIRNEHGFRLKLAGTKKPFPTLQMMLTHHSVLEGHLPCTLHFVQWQKTNFKQQQAATNDRPPRAYNRHSTALTKIDENRNLTTSTPNGTMYRPSGRCGDGLNEFATPKSRRSRHEINAMRRSHFFDDRHILL